MAIKLHECFMVFDGDVDNLCLKAIRKECVSSVYEQVTASAAEAIMNDAFSKAMQ
jgi:hypothetical protein